LPAPAVAARVYESLHDGFEAAGAAVRCVLRRATTEDAPTWVCRRLEIPARSVAWLSETACVAADTGRPLYYARTWWRTDRVRLVLTSADCPAGGSRGGGPVRPAAARVTPWSRCRPSTRAARAPTGGNRSAG